MWSQSTGLPSETAWASVSQRSCLALVTTGHLLREFDQRPAHRHVRCRNAGLAEHLGHVGVAEAHLDARDYPVAIFRPHPLQRCFVVLERLLADRFFEGRRPPRWFAVVQELEHPAPLATPNLVPYAVEQDLTEVGLKRAVVARLEAVEMGDRLDQR